MGALKAEREYRQKEAERTGKLRRGGAPAGNLNASRHPWRTLWRRGAVKPELQWIVPLMQRYADALEADKGGAENISAATRSLIEVAAMARGCSSLILSCAGQYGVVEPAGEGSNRWNISPGLRELPKFLKAEASALLGLGLERQSKPVPSLAEYLEAKEAAKTSAPSPPTLDQASVAVGIHLEATSPSDGVASELIQAKTGIPEAVADADLDRQDSSADVAGEP